MIKAVKAKGGYGVKNRFDLYQNQTCSGYGYTK